MSSARVIAIGKDRRGERGGGAAPARLAALRGVAGADLSGHRRAIAPVRDQAGAFATDHHAGADLLRRRSRQLHVVQRVCAGYAGCRGGLARPVDHARARHIRGLCSGGGLANLRGRRHPVARRGRHRLVQQGAAVPGAVTLAINAIGGLTWRPVERRRDAA